jgi:hypothetical protein
VYVCSGGLGAEDAAVLRGAGPCALDYAVTETSGRTMSVKSNLRRLSSGLRLSNFPIHEVTRRAQLPRIFLTVVGMALIVSAFLSDWPVGKPGFGVFQSALLVMGLALCLVALLAPRVAPQLLLALGSGAVALILAEMGLRVFYQGHLTGNLRPHPRYLFELIPGSRRYKRRAPIDGGQTELVLVDSQGYRGEELRASRNGPRVVVYGDSYIEAEFSDLKNTFVWRLQQRLNARLARPVEVINAGVYAYGPDQVSLRMEDELPRLKPDLVIVALYAGNDFGDLLRNKLYTIDPDGSLRLHAVSIGDSLAWEFRLAQPGGLMIAKLFRALMAMTRPKPRPVNLIEGFLKEKQREYHEATEPGRRMLIRLLDPYDIDVSGTPESAQAVYQKRLMEGVLAQIRRTADHNGTRLLLLIIPSPTDVCDACEAGHVDSTEFPAYRRSALTDALQQIATEEQSEAFNLFRPAWLREVNQIYFRRDPHWNDRGQALAAQLVGDYVVSRRLLQHSDAADASRSLVDSAAVPGTTQKTR